MEVINKVHTASLHSNHSTRLRMEMLIQSDDEERICIPVQSPPGVNTLVDRAIGWRTQYYTRYSDWIESNMVRPHDTS